MSEQFRAPVGTHDVLNPESRDWIGLVSKFNKVVTSYGFGLVISPMFEDVAVFNRGIGEQSDVAQKEMYVFKDRGDRTYALRPEGTASVVRAFVQHQPTIPWRAWYVTPAFRYERPQAGRFRQHHQVGVEAIGSDDAQLDVEVISMAHRFYREIGLTNFRLIINSMGHGECRKVFTDKLLAFLETHRSELCEEHQTKWKTNPLRVLDCKRELCINVVSVGPQLPESLCAECAGHFATVCSGLDALGIAFERSPRLVRGFDYYTRTTFEFVSDALDSAQNAIGGGGRYDGLVAQLGGDAVSGIGFGSGIERLLLAREAEGIEERLFDSRPDIFLVATEPNNDTLVMAAELRDAGWNVDRSYDGRSMKSQMKVADRSGARFAVIVGPRELETESAMVRDLRGVEDAEKQKLVSRAELVTYLRREMDGN